MKKLVLPLMAVVMASVLYAGSDKSSEVSDNTALPNGKPFQTIQASLDSLQSQIYDLVGATENIEDRLDALEAAVLALQARDVELLVLIENNDGDIADLEATVANNAALIAAMQTEIVDLTATVAFKQNIIDGKCPSGEFMVAVNEDGSVMCRTDEIGDVGGITSYTAYNFMDLGKSNLLDSSDKGTVTATCDKGDRLTGGGFDTDSSGVYIYTSKPYRSVWKVTAVNNNVFAGETIQVYAQCIKLH